MKNNLKTYENRIAKLKHKLKHLKKGINDFKDLNKLTSLEHDVWGFRSIQ